ncbi:MAG: hypothetical protein JWQ40_1361 [Segetibacter sp.]|jgi:hypothetical protein|nr:hypothetical protein [Segetibacter sp.]
MTYIYVNCPCKFCCKAQALRSFGVNSMMFNSALKLSTKTSKSPKGTFYYFPQITFSLLTLTGK